MRLRLSDTAAEQLGYSGDKKAAAEKPGLSPEELQREADRQARRQEKLEAKQRKVEAREAAQKAETALQQGFDAVAEVDARIQKADNRLEKDKAEHAKQVEQKRNRLLNTQRALEKANAEMQEARLALADERKHVPASVAGMQEMVAERAEKVNALRDVFSTAEDAFKNPMLSKSQKSKRNVSLRKTVKGIINT
jgi:chromosome segregation ATPase